MESNIRSIVLKYILYDISSNFLRWKNERHVFQFPKSEVRASEQKTLAIFLNKNNYIPYQDVNISVRVTVFLL